MKKIFVDNKRKIELHRKKVFIHEQKRKKVRKKKWEANKLEKLQYSSKPSWISKDLKKLKHEVKKFNTETIKCPENYSFINNTDEFLNHLNQAIKIWKSKKLVDFDLTDVENLRFDSLCLLLAYSRDKQNFKMWVKWNFPKNPQIREFVRKSWFLEDFWWKKSWKMIHWESDKQLSQSLSKTIIKTIEKHTFLWNKQITQKAKINPFLVEAMKNTEDHAWWYNWRAFYYKDDGLVTKVCLLDLWKWILKTMYNKVELLIWENPLNLIEDLFKWNIESPKRRTKTKEEKRGTWLPAIYDFLRWSKVKNAFAITNNVKYNIACDKCEYLKMDFHWTFYYWEIAP